jgi:guanine deaminase
MDRNERWMAEAIRLSRNCLRYCEGGPFGCVIVRGEELIAEGWNRVIADRDPTAHAEMVAIREACRKLNNFLLTDCEIFSSCEPCPMCMGAIYWSRPRAIYFANTREDAATIGFDDSYIYEQLRMPGPERGIPTHQILQPTANQVFHEWKAAGNRPAY